MTSFFCYYCTDLNIVIEFLKEQRLFENHTVFLASTYGSHLIIKCDTEAGTHNLARTFERLNVTVSKYQNDTDLDYLDHYEFRLFPNGTMRTNLIPDYLNAGIEIKINTPKNHFLDSHTTLKDILKEVHISDSNSFSCSFKVLLLHFLEEDYRTKLVQAYQLSTNIIHEFKFEYQNHSKKDIDRDMADSNTILLESNSELLDYCRNLLTLYKNDSDFKENWVAKYKHSFINSNTFGIWNPFLFIPGFFGVQDEELSFLLFFLRNISNEQIQKSK